MVKNWLIENDKETDDKIVIFRQFHENLNCCVGDIEKTTHQTIVNRRENSLLSDVGYQISDDNDNEKDFPFRTLVNM